MAPVAPPTPGSPVLVGGGTSDDARGSDYLKITWAASSGCVYAVQVNGNVTMSDVVPAVTLTTLKPQTTYTVAIQATDEASGLSSGWSAQLVTITRPPAPAPVVIGDAVLSVGIVSWKFGSPSGGFVQCIQSVGGSTAVIEANGPLAGQRAVPVFPVGQVRSYALRFGVPEPLLPEKVNYSFWGSATSVVSTIPWVSVGQYTRQPLRRMGYRL